MDVAELRRRLDEAGVPSPSTTSTSTGYGFRLSGIAFARTGGFRWLTYYRERGPRVGEQVWLSEDEACSHPSKVLLQENERDPRNRRADACRLEALKDRSVITKCSHVPGGETVESEGQLFSGYLESDYRRPRWTTSGSYNRPNLL
jgi:hypothetical protein